MKIVVEDLLAGVNAPLTIAAYAQCWRDYLDFSGGEADALQAKTLANYRAYLVRERAASRSTVNKYIFGIKAVVKAVYQRGGIDRNSYYDFREIEGLPSNALPERQRKHARTRITPDQMRAIVDATDGVKPVAARLFHRALLLTLASSGMRISECVRIRAEDIEERDDGCVVTNVLAKAKGEARDVPISTEACKAIQAWLAKRATTCAYVFNADGAGDHWREFSDRHIDRTSAGRVVKHYAANVGIQHCKAHDFRRFVGTMLVQKKGIRAAQVQLGHSNISTTARFYDMSELDAQAVNNLF